MLQIKKRSGEIVPFDKSKIITAINKAFIEVDGALYETDTADDIASDIEARLKSRIASFIPEVEQIQDWVEEYLMRSERQDVARSYIRYRYKKELARGDYNELMDAVADRISGKNNQKKNANMDESSFGGRIGETTNLIMREYALKYLMSDLMRENHLNNEVYVHDLDYYAVGCHNCLSIPFDDLLANGFNTKQTDVRPANSINTAFQLVAVIFQLQSLQQFGGVSATHLDWTMVPYVRKSFAKHYLEGSYYLECSSEFLEEASEKNLSEFSIEDDFYKQYPCIYQYAIDMTVKELNQAVEGMYHNLNTLQSRSGNQLPFTSINYGTCTLPEGRMVIKALLRGSIKGVGKLHKTAIFPCGIFQCGKGINKNPEDPNYDLFLLALKSTAQRLYPNYANVDWSGNAGYDRNDPTTYFSTMGCRTANGWDINGLKQQKDGRGNIAPVTIILPTLAMMAKEMAATEIEAHLEDRFMQLLDEKIFALFLDILVLQ